MENLWTVEELANYLKKPVTTLYGWHYRSEGPPTLKIGRHLRYRESDVLAWLDQLATESKSALASPSKW